MNFNKKILSLRKKEKLTQEQMADILGVTRQTISNWELDITKPDIDQITKISNIFKISIDELLGQKTNDIIINKIEKTENMVSKNYKKIKILLLIIYLVLLMSAISIIIYCLTKKDFTKQYQTEFICYNEKETYNISLEDKNGDIYIKLSEYNTKQKQWIGSEEYYAGKTLNEMFENLESIKETLIIHNNMKCK